MDLLSGKPLSAFGFLTVLQSPEHGLFGGYLVLSPQGRPLEFRCSTPIAPSRAQEILYGPTLRSYLLAEVIGQALVSTADLPVRLILTDLRDMAPLALVRAEPVVCVEPIATDAASPTAQIALECNSIKYKGFGLILGPTAAWEPADLPAMIEPLAAHVDLCEPFERIRAALTEAQIASHHAPDNADDRPAAA